MENIIEVQNMSKRFNREVLSAINFTFEKGRTVGLVGKNGAGKTTMIKILLGFLKPSAGKVRILGKEPKNAAGNIGYLPEKPEYHLLFSGREYLALLGRISGISRVNHRVEEVLRMVEMNEHATKRMSRYSKGMLQRIGVAQAVLLDPELLILDEPLSGLDPDGQKGLRDIFVELQRLGKSIFLSSHLLNEVERICTDIAIIDLGKIIKYEEIDQALQCRDRYELRFEGIRGEDLDRIKEHFLLSEVGQNIYLYDEQSKGEKEKLLAKLIEAGGTINELKASRKTLEEYFISTTRGLQ